MTGVYKSKHIKENDPQVHRSDKNSEIHLTEKSDYHDYYEKEYEKSDELPQEKDNKNDFDDDCSEDHAYKHDPKITRESLLNKELNESFDDKDMEKRCLQSLLLIGLQWEQKDECIQAQYKKDEFVIIFNYEGNILLCNYLHRGTSLFSAVIDCLNGTLKTNGDSIINISNNKNIFTHIVHMFVYSVTFGDIGRIVNFITNFKHLTFDVDNVIYGTMCVAQWNEENKIYLGTENGLNDCFLQLISSDTSALKLTIFITFVICVFIIIVLGVFIPV